MDSDYARWARLCDVAIDRSRPVSERLVAANRACGEMGCPLLDEAQLERDTDFLLKERRGSEPKTVIITVEGGVIQDVDCPEGVRVIVRDYDVEDVDPSAWYDDNGPENQEPPEYIESVYEGVEEV